MARITRNPLLLTLGLLAIVGITLGALGFIPLLNGLRAGRINVLEISRQDSVLELPPAKWNPGDWPEWGGPDGDNHSADIHPPLTWSETENVIWKQPIPGSGNGSPIVIGDRIFLPSSTEDPPRQFLLALDRKTGMQLWETTIHEGALPHKHDDNTHASATPAGDGERVFVAFGQDSALRLTALDFNGKVLWSTRVGPHGGSSSHGQAASPRIAGSFVIVADDTPNGGYVAAIHRASGEVVWLRPRAVKSGSYGTPTIAELGGRKMILLSGCDKLAAYDLDNGNPIWENDGLADVSANAATVGENMAFGSTGYSSRRILAVNSDGSTAWSAKGNQAPYPPSMLYNKGYLYIASDRGGICCKEARTGKDKWEDRLGSDLYASPVLAGDRIFISDHRGMTTVIEANPDHYKVLARNRLGERIDATPVIIGGKIYLRTEHNLYCIGENVSQ